MTGEEKICGTFCNMMYVKNTSTHISSHTHYHTCTPSHPHTHKQRKNISNPFSPSSPGNLQLGQPRPHTSSSNSQSSSTYSTEHPTNRRGYSHEFGTQLSNVSYGSVEEEEALKESLKRFERCVCVCVCVCDP